MQWLMPLVARLLYQDVQVVQALVVVRLAAQALAVLARGAAANRSVHAQVQQAA